MAYTLPSQDKMIGDQQNEIDILHAENALKLTQILDLEQLLYDMKLREIKDGSPCWCKYPLGLNHSLLCMKAREATEPFWRKPDVQP